MKKEIILPLIIILLGIIFLLINIIVFFSKGNTWFVKKKLKVGAMILTLTSITACHTVPRHTCYEPVQTKVDTDSTNYSRQQDSIKKADNNKRINDSIAKIKPIKNDSIRVTCYEMPAPIKEKQEKK